eukprot:SAG11_NODE_241_length_11781_cov_8.401900_5_plen_159_part_00
MALPQDHAKLFRFYDRNNDGTLEFDEFRRAIRKDGKLQDYLMPDVVLRDIFDAVDSDHDGQIGAREFEEIFSVDPAELCERIRFLVHTRESISMYQGTSDGEAYQSLPAGEMRLNANGAGLGCLSCCHTHSSSKLNFGTGRLPQLPSTDSAHQLPECA